MIRIYYVTEKCIFNKMKKEMSVFILHENLAPLFWLPRLHIFLGPSSPTVTLLFQWMKYFLGQFML